MLNLTDMALHRHSTCVGATNCRCRCHAGDM